MYTFKTTYDVRSIYKVHELCGGYMFKSVTDAYMLQW